MEATIDDTVRNEDGHVERIFDSGHYDEGGYDQWVAVASNLMDPSEEPVEYFLSGCDNWKETM